MGGLYLQEEMAKRDGDKKKYMLQDLMAKRDGEGKKYLQE